MRVHGKIYATSLVFGLIAVIIYLIKVREPNNNV